MSELLEVPPFAPFPDGPPPPDDGPSLRAAGMGTVDDALAFLELQRTSGSTAWRNMCESLCRQAYALPAHYPSANAHAAAIPPTFRHGHEPPSRGDLALMVNETYGHIVVCTGRGWESYSNDVAGPGRVSLVADLRDMVRWCGASSWFVADAWWSSSSYRTTHGSTTPPPAPPSSSTPTTGDDAMFLAEVKYGSNGTTWWLVAPGGMVGIGSKDAATWTGTRLKVTDEAEWRRIILLAPQLKP